MEASGSLTPAGAVRRWRTARCLMMVTLQWLVDMRRRDLCLGDKHCTPEEGEVPGDVQCYVGACVDDETTGLGCTTEERPSSASCDDGDPCTEYDRCDAGNGWLSEGL